MENMGLRPVKNRSEIQLTSKSALLPDSILDDATQRPAKYVSILASDVYPVS